MSHARSVSAFTFHRPIFIPGARGEKCRGREGLERFVDELLHVNTVTSVDFVVTAVRALHVIRFSGPRDRFSVK